VTVSILIPFRDPENGRRTVVLQWLLKKWAVEYPEAEVIVEGDDGKNPFCKSMAVNRAVCRATGDILVITDADVWLQPNVIREAATRGQAWVTKRQKIGLSKADTDALLRIDPLRWRGVATDQERERAEWHSRLKTSPPIMFTRVTYTAVNGMDERFRGWGGEDRAFGLALETIVGPATSEFTEDAVHLFHPRFRVQGKNAWVGQKEPYLARQLSGKYSRTVNNKAEMLKLVEGNR